MAGGGTKPRCEPALLEKQNATLLLRPSVCYPPCPFDSRNPGEKATEGQEARRKVHQRSAKSCAPHRRRKHNKLRERRFVERIQRRPHYVEQSTQTQGSPRAIQKQRGRIAQNLQNCGGGTFPPMYHAIANTSTPPSKRAAVPLNDMFSEVGRTHDWRSPTFGGREKKKNEQSQK